ncbi:MAG: PadR family transcriptional regulator [Candidatus Tumulicola sp.]
MECQEINATAAAILGLLHRSPMSGYDLAAQIDRSIGYFWNVTRSQLYRETKDLAERRLITLSAKGARDRRVCSLTTAGRRAFAAWIAQPTGLGFVRLPLLLSLFFAEHVEAKRVREWMAHHRKLHVERLAMYEQVLPHIRESAPYPPFCLEFGIEYERMLLRWLRSVEERLPERD